MYAPPPQIQTLLRRIVVDVIFELLFFCKYITEQIIPYHLSGITIKEIP